MHANRGMYAAPPVPCTFWLGLVPAGWVFSDTPDCDGILAGTCGSGGLFNHPCFGAVRVTHATTEPSPPRGVSLINTVVKVNAFHFLAMLYAYALQHVCRFFFYLYFNLGSSYAVRTTKIRGISRWPFGPDCSGCLL